MRGCECADVPRFAYSPSALRCLILQPKKYEQKHFQSIVLSEAQRAEEERNDSRDVSHHGERQGIAVQQQAGCGGKDVERGDRTVVRAKPHGTGREPYA